MNANSGRFWTRDSYEGQPEEPQSLHKYLYASDNPVNRIDPGGQQDFISTLTVIFIAGTQTATKEGATVRAGVLAGVLACAAIATVSAVTSAAITALSDPVTDNNSESVPRTICEVRFKRKQMPRLYVFESIMPKTARHIAEAQFSGQPAVLEYDPSPANKIARRTAVLAKLPLSGDPEIWRDEYPFASTYQGGATSSVQYVPMWEQRIQAVDLRLFYQGAKLKNKSKFLVIVVPNM